MIQGIEWIIVAVVILVIFLWGPEKLPKFARSIGQAKKEFERASKGLDEEARKLREEARAVVSPSSPTTSVQTQPPVDDKLLEVARSLGIETEGKTRDQIAKEIIEKSKDNLTSDAPDEKNKEGKPASSKA